MLNYWYQVQLLRPLNFKWRYVLLLNLVDTLGNIQVFEVRPNIFFFNITAFRNGANSSGMCKRYIVFAFFGVTRVTCNKSPSMSFFVKYVHPNAIGFRRFVYHGIKKQGIEVVLFHSYCFLPVFASLHQIHSYYFGKIDFQGIPLPMLRILEQKQNQQHFRRFDKKFFVKKKMIVF